MFAKTTLTTTAVTTAVWVLVTLSTPPEPDDVLLSFYRKVKPDVAGWRRIAALAPDLNETRDLVQNLRAWLLGCAMVYSALFGIGKFCFGRVSSGAGLLALATVCAVVLYRDISRRVGKDSMGCVNV